jgi:hypothetical protein
MGDFNGIIIGNVVKAATFAMTTNMILKMTSPYHKIINCIWTYSDGNTLNGIGQVLLNKGL